MSFEIRFDRTRTHCGFTIKRFKNVSFIYHLQIFDCITALKAVLIAVL